MTIALLSLASLFQVSPSQATTFVVTFMNCVYIVVQAMATLLALTGWVPGVIARQRNLPHWGRTCLVGLFGSIFFFPLTLILLAKVYQKRTVSQNGHIGSTGSKEPVRGGGSL
jgi:hypothetical protein